MDRYALGCLISRMTSLDFWVLADPFCKHPGNLFIKRDRTQGMAEPGCYGDEIAGNGNFSCFANVCDPMMSSWFKLYKEYLTN